MTRLVPSVAGRALGAATSATTAARVLGASGVVRPLPPTTLARMGKALKSWGTGAAGGFTAMALRDPGRVALIDERGPLTFGEIHERSNALARALAERGVREGDGVALMCRNHRGFVDSLVAISKLGADVLLLNTAFAGPQLADVLEREGPRVVIHDQEFTGLLSGADIETRILGWVDDDTGPDGEQHLEDLLTSYDGADLPPVERHGRIVILTSGTTGTPKGAPRSEAGLGAAVSLLSRMPLRYGWRTHIAAPLFHTWGFAHLALSMLLGSTVVLRRRFEPEACLAAVRDEGCESLVVIPVMLQRILNLPQDTLDSYSLPTLEVTAASGSTLPGDLATTWMDTFGDNLYNIYGSTEVAYASIATPADLRAAPTSAGKPPWATVVKILDPLGREVPQGETGRIFVGNGMLFEGYTGGPDSEPESKEVIDGLMASGDVGRFDDQGRLYVEGRDDDMIVSGGENVFPQEVEDCLSRHERVVDVAAVGVDDDAFGKRLRAFVVVSEPRPTEDELKDWVRTHLARYKVPREIVFLDELPRNATGKILKRELAEHD